MRFVLLISLLSLLSCRKENGPAEAALQTVRAGTVEQITPETMERYSATISPIEQIDLAFKSAGLVAHILTVRGADGRMRDVQVGDIVTKGTELAAVRALDYEQRVQQAQTTIGQAEAQLAQSQANLSEATIEYTRAKNLFDSASLVKPQFDQAKGRYESALASVDGAKAAVANARSVADQANLSLKDTALYAPFTGYVTARNVQAGSLVGNSTVGFSMMDAHLVKAVFAVPDTSLKNVHLGQKQTVMLDALQQEFQGTVTSIAPQADPKSRVFQVEVTIANSSEQVRPGMIGTLLFGNVRETKTRLVIPLGAVVHSTAHSDGFAVFRVRNREGKTIAEAQDIQIGNTYGNSIEVTSGLSAGDRIVSLGGSLLRDGQEVRLLP